MKKITLSYLFRITIFLFLFILYLYIGIDDLINDNPIGGAFSLVFSFIHLLFFIFYVVKKDFFIKRSLSRQENRKNQYKKMILNHLNFIKIMNKKIILKQI